MVTAHPAADLQALVSGLTARWTVRYGEGKTYLGADLPRRRTKVPTRHGPVPVDVYAPDGEPTGVYVHFHGGAFIMRFPRMDEFFCRFVAASAGAVVVNVDYDVAPFHRYPVAHEQAHDVLARLTTDPGQVGAPGTAVAVGGWSAGGGLAASACLQARDAGTAAPVLQLLAVPSLDVAGDIHDKVATVPNPMITPSLLRLVRRTYFRDADRRSEPYASPLLAPDVRGLPPALVLTAERDLLRGEGDAYAARLAAAGVPVTHQVVPGADHYFLEGAAVPARDLMQTMANHLRAALTGSPV